MSLIFLDTEFTDFTNCDLISIGMVSTGGHELYFERNDYEQKWSSEFVRANIVPMLGKQGVRVGSKEECAQAVREFFAGLPYEKIVVVVDYYQDLHLLADLLDNDYGPKYAGAAYLQNLFDHYEAARACLLAAEDFFAEQNVLQHHALDDAKANRAGWIAGMKQLGVF